MSLHHIANHLASKGRHGDTTLVHMTKGEVAGLQALAKAHGTSLTRNPDTGLPEAFGLKQLLPMAAGAALVASGVGAPMAAAMVGGGMFAATGSLQQGLMAGLGAYGGAGLAGMAGLGAAAAPAGTQAVAGQVGEAAVAPEVVDAVATPVEAIQAGGSAAPATQQYAGAYQPTSFSAAPADTLTSTQAYAPTPTQYGAFGEAPAPLDSGTSVADATQQNAAASYGTQTVSQTPKPSFMDNVMANKMQTAQYGMAAAAPLMVKDPQEYKPPERKVDSDMGQRYAFDSGYSNDIPGRTGPAEYKQISNEEAKKLYGFAEGGDVQYPYGESVVRMADGGATVAPAAQSAFTGYGPVDAYVAARGLGTGVNFSGYDAPANQGIAAVAPQAASGANPNQRIVDLYKAADARRAAEEAAAKAAELSGNGYTIGKPGRGIGASRGSSGSDVVGVRADGTPVYGEFSADANGLYGPGSRQYDTYMAQQRASIANANYAGASGGSVSPEGFGMAAGGGISTLGGYSDGGRLLKGPGDGMSDNIPAQIGAKQPARLADGEFVVPADVVSHLGNGSTDAGAKQLYKMMDKIRTARTGRKAQGKQVNPNKFLPA